MRAASRDEALPQRLATPHGRASLPPQDRALLDYADKLTRTPSAVSADDLDALRSNGLSDDAIVRVVEITAYFNFVNRIAEGLGARLEV